VTVLFLGQVEVKLVPEVKTAIETIVCRTAGFRLTLKEIGPGPRPNRPRLIWALFEGSEPFGKLAGELRKKLGSIISLEDARKPRPHITLGRFRRGHSEFALPPTQHIREQIGMEVEKMELWESKLTPTGAIYSTLATYRLLDQDSQD